jgi:hypothetical protein
VRTLAQPGDGGKDGSRNPFSRRRRSNDEFREAGLVWAARRGSWASPVPQQARAARWSPLACFIFRFLKRPLFREGDEGRHPSRPCPQVGAAAGTPEWGRLRKRKIKHYKGFPTSQATPDRGGLRSKSPRNAVGSHGRDRRLWQRLGTQGADWLYYKRSLMQLKCCGP